MKPTPSIAQVLGRIIAATETLLAGDVSLEEGQALLARRDHWVKSAMLMKTGGAPWGDQEEAHLQRIRDLDETLLRRIRAPLSDAFAWMHAREAKRKAASNASH